MTTDQVMTLIRTLEPRLKLAQFLAPTTVNARVRLTPEEAKLLLDVLHDWVSQEDRRDALRLAMTAGAAMGDDEASLGYYRSAAHRLKVEPQQTTTVTTTDD